MQVHKGKLKLWGQPGGSLPPALAECATETLQILGHAVERAAGQLHTLTLGDSNGSFSRVHMAVRQTLERLWYLHEKGGLAKQTTQALARMATNGAPQHVMRGSPVGDTQAAAYDDMVALFWCRMAGKAGSLDAQRTTQIHLPLRLGGLSSGAVSGRADAAFLVGSLGALEEVKSATGSPTIESLRQICPTYVGAMDRSTAKLEEKGVKGPLRLWQNDQPQKLKGRQREWTREVQAKVQEQLLVSTSQRHAVAIRSSASVEASRFLDGPAKPADMMSDGAFQVALRRRLGLPLTPSGTPVAQTCQNIGANGQKCGAVLDAEGQHASTCEVGGALLRRHDSCP